MEKTISLTPSDLRVVDAARLKGYDAVYLGSEFCQNLVPSAADYEKLRAMFPGPVVTMTSLLTESGLAKASEFVSTCLSKQKSFEIVVNDWGFLSFLKKKCKKKAKPILGRLIMWEIARMDKKFLNSFCAEYGIESVETDCQDVLDFLDGYGGRINFNFPFRFRSVTRFCPVIKNFNSHACAGACKGAPAKLTNPEVLGEPLYMRGNAYFTPNALLTHKSIKRTVETFLIGVAPTSPKTVSLPANS